MITVAISGGFDPVHKGHIKHIQEARKLGDKLVVLLNNDNWLLKKKGYVFMPQEERKLILEAITGVDEVIITSHPKNPEDMSICRELEKIRPGIFAKGGDRDEQNAADAASSLNPERALCQKLNIKLKFNVGGKKAQSSSELVNRVHKISN